MRRLVAGALSSYLAMGLLFAIVSWPQQTWTCPDASQPHGTVTHGGLDEAPAEDCRPRYTTVDRLQYVAVVPVAWLPLAVARGLADS